MFKAAIITALLFAVSGPALAKKQDAQKKPTALYQLYKVDSTASQIDWTGRKVLVESAHTGTLKLKSGEIQFADGVPKAGSFEIDMNSLTNTDLTDAKKKGNLEGHLKSDDFFDVAKHPTATFKIAKVTALPKPAAGQPTHEITGNLTLKGKTESITFPATIATEDGTAEATAVLKIDRTKWDVRFGSGKFFKNLGDKVIADDLELNLKVVARK